MSNDRAVFVTNQALMKVLGIDGKDVSKVVIIVRPNDLPHVEITKCFITANDAVVSKFHLIVEDAFEGGSTL